MAYISHHSFVDQDDGLATWETRAGSKVEQTTESQIITRTKSTSTKIIEGYHHAKQEHPGIPNNPGGQYLRVRNTDTREHASKSVIQYNTKMAGATSSET